MDLIVNDLSLHGQFVDLSEFRDAIGRVMAIRQIAKEFGRALYCHRNVANAQVTQDLSMRLAAQRLLPDERRALMQWLDKHGPFWEDVRTHGPDEYLECDGKIVTDTAVGEAAYCCFQSAYRSLVSFIPSAWKFTPVLVAWLVNESTTRTHNVNNYWDADQVEAALREASAPPASWRDLEKTCASGFPHLQFSTDAFECLRGHPFVVSAADRILCLLEVLEKLKCCFDEDGERTHDGHHLYREHFTGARGLFSDSSDTEKRDFQKELTFCHPTVKGKFLYCTWHGKVNSPKLRIHFSWPVTSGVPLYVVYIGPKITKR